MLKAFLYFRKVRRERNRLVRTLTEEQRELVKRLRSKSDLCSDASAYDAVNLACGNGTSLAGEVAASFLALLAQLRATGMSSEQERLLIYDELPDDSSSE